MPRFTTNVAASPSPLHDTTHEQPPPHEAWHMHMPTSSDDEDDIILPGCRLTPESAAYMQRRAIKHHAALRHDAHHIQQLFQQLDEHERARIQAIQEAFRSTQASLKQADLAQHSRQVEDRDVQLDGLKRAHQAAAAAARQEAAALKAAADHAAQQAKLAAEQAAAEQAAKVHQEQERAAAAVAAALSAKQQEEQEKQQQAQQQQQKAPSTVPATPEQRQLKKRLTLYVQQISATQEQVASRTQAILTLLASTSSEADGEFATALLADRIVAQAEAQVVRLNSFAFPLAMVAVAVACYHARFSNVLVASLTARVGGLLDGHITGPTTKLPGSIDDEQFYDRLRGYFLFYGAFCSVEAPNHPHGLPHVWRWCARVLNALATPSSSASPAGVRAAAVALDAMLHTAGYRMGRVYGRQWDKMMQYVRGTVVPQLGDAPAIRGVRTRIHVFVEQGEWRAVPEGSVLKVGDDSSYERA